MAPAGPAQPMKKRAPSTHKKVIVETFAGKRLRGYVNLRNFDRETGLELLDPGGQHQQLAWKTVKIAWFVRDWEETLPGLEINSFPRRPRLEGLWLRLRFRDNQVLEGVLVNDLLHLSPHGYLITPPDLNSNHQKAFVPRAALTAVEVLAVVPARGAARRRPAAPAQPRLFNP